MRPISYKEENGITTFQYNQEELDKWKELGERDGNVGVILVRRTESPKMTTYYGYGTIENPSRTPMTMSLMHHPVFDGNWKTNEEIINPVSDPKGQSITQ